MKKLIDEIIKILEEEKRTTLLFPELFHEERLRSILEREIKFYMINESCNCCCHHLHCECEDSKQCSHCLDF